MTALLVALTLAPPALRVELPAARLRVFEPYELACEVIAPADPLAVGGPRPWAEIAAPDRVFEVPGFVFQPFRGRLDRLAAGGLREVFEPLGPPTWRIRFTPLVGGAHTVTVRAEHDGQVHRAPPIRLQARLAKAPGFARLPAEGWPRRDGADPAPWIGANVAWAHREGTFELDGILRKLGGARANLVRLWLHSPTRTYDPLDPLSGAFVPENAARLEAILERCRLQRLQVMLVLAAPAHQPPGRFADPAWRARSLRAVEYLLARFAADPNIVAWELCAGADAAVPGLAAWCGDARALLERMDPYARPVGLSVAGDDPGSAALFGALPGLSYLGLALPWSSDPLPGLRAALTPAAPARLVASYGANAAPPPEAAAEHLHDLLWAGLFRGRTGAALPWHWEAWLRRRELFGSFTPVAEYAAAVRWQDLTPATIAPAPGWTGEVLRGPGQYLAWLRRDAGAPPLEKLLVEPAPAGCRARAFDPWTGEWRPTAARREGREGLVLALPAAERDLAILIQAAP